MKEELLSHKYKTSKDYELLFELQKTQRIVCFVDVKDFKNLNEYRLQDICQTQVRTNKEVVEICTRGIAYISAFAFKKMSLKDDFISQCEKQNLEFIVPNNK